MPLVTVLMPVYNGEKYLVESIDSILNQSFKDFEFLIINDGSTDKSEEIIRSYQDPRIRIINNEENMKLIASLNIGFKLATGKYIARMDSDDISMPLRLEKQVEFMENNQDISVCGSWALFYSDSNILRRGVFRMPSNPEQIRYSLLFRCCLIHPTIMLRKEDFINNGLFYDSEYECAEDFDLWNRAAKTLKFYNIEEIHLKYRLSPNGISRKHYHLQKTNSARIRNRIYEEMGVIVGDEFYDVVNTKKENLLYIEDKILRLKEKIEYEIDEVHKKYLKRALFDEWYEICRNSSNNGLMTWRIFTRSELNEEGCIFSNIKFFLKCLFKIKSN
jgi:glycosyltransferase involved in cell wall biosynthesis